MNSAKINTEFYTGMCKLNRPASSWGEVQWSAAGMRPSGYAEHGAELGIHGD